jgi:hypothetical protein
MAIRMQPKIAKSGHSSGFHHAWCNSPAYVNETLQRLQIVLTSDPFNKDSQDSAEPKICRRSRSNFRAIPPDRLSAVM